MQTITLPGLDKPVSRIILGTGWFNTRQEPDIHRLLDAYVALGGNAFDTGRFYSGGESEAVFSRWLAGHMARREDFVITSKACHHYVDAHNVHYPQRSRVSADNITADLHHSLALQGHDCFDLYMIHRDDPSVPVSELMDRLELHRREGKLRVCGVSNWSLARTREAADYCARMGYPGPKINSPGFSLASVTNPRFPGAVYADEDYVRRTREQGLAVLAWGAQAAGFLADIYPRHGGAPADIAASYFSPENFARLDRAKALARDKGCEAVNVALAYVLSLCPAAIIAPHSEKELRSSLRALEIHLTPEELRWLKDG